MKKVFENIINAIQLLPASAQNFIIKQLKIINDKIAHLEIKVEEKSLIIAGKRSNTYTNSLEKAVDLLRLFGFNENTFEGISPDFLNWMLLNTLPIIKYNPKLQNYYLINSFQQAYFIFLAENDGKEPTYKQLRTLLLTFEDVIKEYENESNRTLNELINNTDGQN